MKKNVILTANIKQMRPITLKSTTTEPEINLDPVQGLIEIKGRSIPENPIEFYKPVLNWLADYSANPQPLTTVNIDLEYFNTSSARCLFQVLKSLETLSSAIKLNWMYEEGDEDIRFIGEDFKARLKLKEFNIIEVPIRKPFKPQSE